MVVSVLTDVASSKLGAFKECVDYLGLQITDGLPVQIRERGYMRSRVKHPIRIRLRLHVIFGLS